MEQITKGIIFDFDGVLCDSHDLHKEALKNSLFCLGYNWCKLKDEKYEEIKNKKTKEKLLIFSSLGFIDKKDISDLYELKQSYTRSLILEKTVDEKVKNNLKKLKINNKLAIASDANKETIILFLKVNSILDYFDVIVTSEDVNGVSKPLPNVYLKTLEVLGINSIFLTVFEDTEEGCEAAISSGIKNVLMCNVNNLAELLENL